MPRENRLDPNGRNCSGDNILTTVQDAGIEPDIVGFERTG